MIVTHYVIDGVFLRKPHIFNNLHIFTKCLSKTISILYNNRKNYNLIFSKFYLFSMFRQLASWCFEFFSVMVFRCSDVLVFPVFVFF